MLRKIDRLDEKVDEGFAKLDERFSGLEGKISGLDVRMSTMEHDFVNLINNQAGFQVGLRDLR